MELERRRVGILIEDFYEDQEFWYPYYRLREAGATVQVIGTGKKDYKSKYGYPVTANTTADKISANELDALIIPGGYAPDHLRRHAAVIDLVSRVHAQGKIVAAICHAGWVLCSARIVKGRTITGFFAIKDDLINAGATYVDSEVVRDGNLITSRKPDDLPAFLRAIIDALQEAPTKAVPAKIKSPSARHVP